MATAAITQLEELQPDFGVPVHEVCDYYPLMDGDARAKLALDIRTNGLVHPVVLHEGELVDGRNRLLACRLAGVDPRFVEWKEIYSGPMSIGRWIRSVNGERRHMTMDQLAATEVAVRGWEEREAAKERQIQQGERGKEGGRGNKKTLPANSTEGFSGRAPSKDRTGETRVQIATAVGCTPYKAQQALTVAAADPDLLKEVAHGRTSLREAERQVKGSPAAEQRKVRSHRIDTLARARVALLEQTKRFTQLVGWLGENHGDFDQAEALLRKASESAAALSAEIERIAVAADPLNASRLGIQKETA